MADTDHDKEFEDAFKGFGEDPAPATPPADPKKPDDPATPPAAAEPPKEEPKKDDEPAKPEPPKDDSKKEEPETPPADPEKKPEEGGEAPKAPEAPAAEEPKPLTEEGVKSIINNIRSEERNSAKELDNTTNEVLEAYYPDGLSNTLIDQSTGKELKTPQDVVDASGGQISTEEAAQWLMNEQYKLDNKLNEIRADARKIAENTINFKRDSIAALQKYEPLFKWQPSLQKKVWEKLQQQVKVDMEKGVILSAPDVMDHYDFYLEPYQKAFEFSQNKPATNPTPPAPEPPKPGAEDRMDIGGDGGSSSDVDDPNDFGQQVKKELAKGL